MKQARVMAMRPRIAAMLLAALVCSPARAHLESSGMGPVYDGLMHFLTSPEDLVAAIALSILAGLRGAAYGRRAMFTLPLAWLLGSLLGLTAAAASNGALGAGLWFLLLGGLIVADVKLSLWWLTVLAALLGVVHGYVNGTGMGFSVPAVVAIAGIAVAVFVVSTLIAAAIVPLRAGWSRVAVRVAGSWIAASGLLMLGWSMRGI